MAHNIHFDKVTQKYTMFSAGPLPWHKLGENIAEATDWATAYEISGLNYELVKEPIRTDYGIIESHVAIVRADRPNETISVVRKTYEIIQNLTGFAWTEALLEVGARYEAAGALGNGSRVWVLARVPQADFAIGDDKHFAYLLFETSHDGSRSAVVKLTDVRAICQNTLDAALAGLGTELKIRHTKSADERFRAAQRLISNTTQTSATLAEKLQILANRKLDKSRFESVMAQLFPQDVDAGKAAKTRRENILTEIMEITQANDGNAFPEQKGTFYNLLNAITNHTDHARNTRSTDANKNLSTEQLRAQSAMFGTGAELKRDALNVILQVSDGASTVKTVFVPSASPTPTSPTNLLDSVLEATVVA